MLTEKVIINNTLFVMFDVMETLLLQAEKLYKADNQEFKHQSKQDFNKTLFHGRRFLNSVRECTIDTQMQFGEDAEELLKFIMLFVDRVNDDPSRSDLFFNYMKSNSSLLNFDFKTLNIEL